MRISLQSNGSRYNPDTGVPTVRHAAAAHDAQGYALGQLYRSLGGAADALLAAERQREHDRVLRADNEYTRRVNELRQHVTANLSYLCRHVEGVEGDLQRDRKKNERR